MRNVQSRAIAEDHSTYNGSEQSEKKDGVLRINLGKDLGIHSI